MTAKYTIIDANGTSSQIAGVAVPSGGIASAVMPVDTGGNALTLAPGTAPGTAGPLLVSADGTKAAYLYSGLAFAPVATPTDIIQIQGSATKTGRIRRIKLGGVATAAGNMPAALLRRSAADSAGGTVLSPITAGKLDTTDAAATLVISTIGTANPGVLGAQVGGQLCAGRIQMSAAGSGIAANELIWEFGQNSKAAILRGVGDFLCINLNGAAIPAGGVVDWEILTEEDSS